jgi:DNA-binding transcriptional LysR family regulator
MLKLQQFRLFAAIAEAGSFSAAAEIVGLSQPALSKSVKEMERQLGVELLVRTTRGVHLTSHGAAVAKRAVSIRRELDKMLEDFGWICGEITGEISIGVTALGASRPLAQAVGALRTAHPKVRTMIRELRSSQILDLVRNGALDCGLLTTYGHFMPEDLEYSIIESYDVAIVWGGRHQGTMSLDEVMNCEWVDYNAENSEEGYISTLTRDLDLRPPPNVVHCSSVRLSVLLAAELGAVCHFVRQAIPSFHQEIEAGRLSVLELDRAIPKMNLMLVHADRDFLSPAAREFTKLIRSGSFHSGL